MTTSQLTRNAWTGRLPVEDTQLHVIDHGGDGIPVLFLNGCFADTSHWNTVLDRLDRTRFRTVLYDGRARGKSGTSSDYSFAAAVRDAQAVIAARGLVRPILCGWSYGAHIGAQYASEHPEAVRGVACVDGALPYGLTGEEGREQLRRVFRRLGWLFPIASRLGFAARMSAMQHAEVNIEGNEIFATEGADMLRSLKVPTRYVLGTGGHLGASDAIMAECRASLDPVLAANPNLKVSARVGCNHSKILARYPQAVVDMITELADGSR